MARQAFDLSRLISEASGNVSKGRARKRFFDKKADDATFYVANLADKIKKDAQSKNRRGFLRNFTSGGGRAITSVIANAIAPGSGFLVNAILGAADAVDKNKQFTDKINRLNKIKGTSPEKFAGTFLDDYIKQSITSIVDPTKQGLKSARKVAGLLGAADVGLSLIPGLNQLGEGAGEATTQAASQASGQLGTKLGELLSQVPGVGAAVNIADVASKPLLGAAPSASRGVFQNLGASILTPALLSGAAKEPLLDYLTTNQVEPSVVRAQSPFRRF
tara:strand:+ start:21566 stop:22390 length:825 start_codon:yes stop_codon:yes gene_type:complete